MLQMGLRLLSKDSDCEQHSAVDLSEIASSVIGELVAGKGFKSREDVEGPTRRYDAAHELCTYVREKGLSSVQ